MNEINMYDFIEIGTSDFDTEIQSTKYDVHTNGISIEPIKNVFR